MLPNLSDRWGAKLEVLVPADSEPATVSTRRNALLELKKIDSIRVSSSGKGSNTRLTVEVSMASSSNTCSGLSTTPTESRIQRELFEFKDIATELHEIVDSVHRGERCDLCSAILNWYVFGENPDGLMMRLASNERVARKLTPFLRNLLASTIKSTSDETRGCCSGHTLIPLAVHKFLFNPSASCDAP